MTEMIEKCARAIYEATPRNKPWELLGQHQRQYEKMAAAVIDALMEPTEAMLDAGSDAMWEGVDYSLEPGEGIDGMDSSPVWHAMLSKAKSE